MKPDSLETFVKTHRNEFDSFEPSNQLWEKIDSKLASKEKKTNNLSWIWKAAILIGVIFFTFTLTRYFGAKQDYYALSIDKSDFLIVSRHQIKDLNSISKRNKLFDQKRKKEMEVKEQINNAPKVNLASNVIVNPELEETNKYYTIQIQRKQQELFQYTSNNPEIRKEIQIEFSQLDKALNELKNDLKNNVNNEEVVEAMIQNFRIKLELLESILNQLKNKKNDTIEEIKPKYAI